MRRMTRVTLAGCMALAALGAVSVLDVGSSTAEAAPSVSEFAGSYTWGPMPVTISDGGRIAGSSSSGGDYGYAQDVSISGQVGAARTYSFTRSVTIYYYDLSGRRHQVSKGNFKFAGTMAFDIDGNIVGTATTGDSFVWVRQ